MSHRIWCREWGVKSKEMATVLFMCSMTDDKKKLFVAVKSFLQHFSIVPR